MYKKHIPIFKNTYKKKVFEKCAVAPNLTQRNLKSRLFDISSLLPTLIDR